MVNLCITFIVSSNIGHNYTMFIISIFITIICTIFALHEYLIRFLVIEA